MKYTHVETEVRIKPREFTTQLGDTCEPGTKKELIEHSEKHLAEYLEQYGYDRSEVVAVTYNFTPEHSEEEECPTGATT